MTFISQKANKISPSLTLALTAKAAKLKAEGKDIVSFTAGEPDFNTPDFIVEAAKKAMDLGHTRYTATSGIMPLKQAICDTIKKDKIIDYSPNQIVVSNGAKHSLFNALSAILNEGDEVIILSPYWLTYPEVVSFCGGVNKIIDLNSAKDFKLTKDILIKAITKKTKAIILNNPSNPSGIVYTKDELKALCSVIEKAGIYLISDEIYSKLIYDNLAFYSPASFSDKLKDKTIIIDGLSKAYAMTGWRIGYTASNSDLAAAMVNIQSHTTSNANSIAQYASVEALTNKKSDSFLSELNTTFKERRDYICKLLDEIDDIKYIRPSGAFYVMVDISSFFNKTLHGTKINTAAEFSDLLVDKVGVVTIPLESFGAKNYIRLSYCLSDDGICEGIKRLKQFVMHNAQCTMHNEC